MVDLAFVILQYGGIENTKQCIDSIVRKIDINSYAVVVVDNCSPNLSYGQVKEFFEPYSEKIPLHIIRTEDNLGFAKGNNVGIDFARKELDAKFVAVINNDTELVTENIYEIIQRKYSKEKFAVLGPLILSGDGKYTSNPMGMRSFTVSEIDHEIQHTKRTLTINKYYLMQLYRLYKSVTHRGCQSKDLHVELSDQVDVKLHGCFLVFTPTFFKEMDGFNPETFLYMEEDILLLEVLQRGNHTLYTPDICIFHKEGASTADIKERKKIKMVYSNRLKSQYIYRRILLDQQKNGAIDK